MGRIFIGMSVCMAIGVPCLMYSRATIVNYGVSMLPYRAYARPHLEGRYGRLLILSES